MQHDDDLWEEFIKQCLNKPEMMGVLLEHTVGNPDPLYIVNTVPNGLEIPRLRDRLVNIITDYGTETSLRHGCNDILNLKELCAPHHSFSLFIFYFYLFFNFI
ncbi:hypothetical protein RGQ29_001346 [Quercus rubra]|uniref:Uncharacterized protein n=1 Tax=Quercus rubra TaxID=3512 RepID=A0AAN7JDH7_QUERU|nr:hypothetical protein RGQ29_001346 [Quercus rubra]